jgi:hypothetical protein
MRLPIGRGLAGIRGRESPFEVEVGRDELADGNRDARENISLGRTQYCVTTGPPNL